MKRSVAIFGLTPPFVRWAIERDCALREPVTERMPDQVFRQLRGIRELARGYSQGRVVDGICLHPDCRQVSWEQAHGFQVDEITFLFGGRDRIEATCSGCPANARSVRSESASVVWAGCFGWMTHLFRDPDRAFRWDQLLERFDLRGGRGGGGKVSVPLAGLYQLWQTERWEGERLLQLQAIWAAAQSLFTRSDEAREEWSHFSDAIERSVQSALVLVTELVPAGHSDGRVWRLFPHCSRCRAMMSLEESCCVVCGRDGRPHPEIRRKVLGLRPYGRLVDRIGPERTRLVVAKWERS